MSKKPAAKTPQQRAEQAHADLMSALNASLTPEQMTVVEPKLDACLDETRNAIRGESEEESKAEIKESYESGKSDGYQEGHAEAISAFVGGQASINVIATLRRLEYEARCPFETKAYRALADAVERN